MILANNKKVKLRADLSSVLSKEFEERGSLAKILQVDAETLWLIDQNQLVHYDFKKEKILHTINLNSWRPHQLILDGRTIWLISKNDGQLYALDFEPDESRAAEKKFKNNN